MILTNKQEQGLKIALNRYFNKEKYTVLSGYAGTGKSTLVKFIIEALDINPDLVAYACYTGKAAEVLRRKGNANAMTLHKLLYESIPRKDGGFIHRPKVVLDYKIIVIDEVSMVPLSMINMLLKHNVYVIFLGDPFQIPQIDKNEANNLLEHPHIFLDEVMRQAKDSEIIQMTLKIREGQKIDFHTGNEVMVMPKKELSTSHLTWADQIICATNKTRSAINNQMREILGFSGLPQSGEKMICLRNYWNDLSENGEFALVNGTTGIIQNPIDTYRFIPSNVKVRNHKMDLIICDFIAEDGNIFTNVDMDKKLLVDGEYSLNWQESYALGKLEKINGKILPREFDFGYAITGHKAQGSQWNKVLVIEERFPFDKIEHDRWLYTCCTRPENKLVLVR